MIGRNVTMLMPQQYHDQRGGYLDRYRSAGDRRISGIGLVVPGQRADGSPFAIDLRVNECRTGSVGRVGAYHEGDGVRMERSTDLPGVISDRSQIQQGILDLMRHALEALADVERGEVAIRTQRSGDKMTEVSVADAGPGLPENVIRRVFQPFVTTKKGGMGLGPTVSRSIVEDHRDRLAAALNPSGGVTFQFVLPANTTAD